MFWILTWILFFHFSGFIWVWLTYFKFWVNALWMYICVCVLHKSMSSFSDDNFTAFLFPMIVLPFGYEIYSKWLSGNFPPLLIKRKSICCHQRLYLPMSCVIRSGCYPCSLVSGTPHSYSISHLNNYPVSVIVTFMCQLDWAIMLRYVVKHYSKCFHGGFLRWE